MFSSRKNLFRALLAVVIAFGGRESTSSTNRASRFGIIPSRVFSDARELVLPFPALGALSCTCRSLLALRGGDSNSENDDVEGYEREGEENAIPKGQDAFEIGSSIGQDVNRDQVARMTIADLKSLFAKHGMTNLDDEAASKILAAAKKETMVNDPETVRDDPEVSSWTGRREDYLSESQTERTPQLPALRRGFLTSPSSGTTKASIVHQSPQRSEQSSPMTVTPSPTRFKDGVQSPGSGKTSTPRRRSKVKEVQEGFDLADLEQLNQKMSEIQLKEAFVPEMVHSPRPLEEDTEVQDEEEEEEEEAEDDDDDAEQADGAEEDATSSEMGVSSEGELEDKDSEEIDEMVQAQLRKLEKSWGLRRKPNISHPILDGRMSWAELEAQEARKGMGGMFWRSHLLFTLEKNESEGLELIDQVPYLGDPDESLFPPSKGVGDNMNATREREEAMHTLLLDAVYEDDAIEIDRLFREEGVNINLRDYTTETDAATPLQYAIEYESYDAAFKLLVAPLPRPSIISLLFFPYTPPTPIPSAASIPTFGQSVPRLPAHPAPASSPRFRSLLCSLAQAGTGGGRPQGRQAGRHASLLLRCPQRLARSQGEGDNEMVRLLVEGGADVNGADHLQGETPLFDAAANGWTDTCLLLLQLGADPCAKNKLNYQPYFCAQEWDRWETAQALIGAMGANYTKLATNEYPQPPGRAPRPGEMTRKPVPGDSDYSNDEYFMGGKVEEEEEELDEEIEGSQMMAAAVNHSKAEEAGRRKRAKERRANQELAASLD